MVQQRRSARQFMGWMLLVLLAAAALRLWSLTAVPPGLTHDEADHGITAVSILQGSREIYFAIANGREPLYDYLTAGVMLGVGQTFLAGRLVAVWASLLMLAGMAAWVRRAFDWQTAVLTAAGLAVGFWPLMAARQSLRSILLPTLLVWALVFFWQGVRRRAVGRTAVAAFAAAGVLLGLSFYTYIPARALWLLFPLAWGYLWWAQRPLARQTWRGVLMVLGMAALLAWPLLAYLRAHPEAETRIRELVVTDGAQLWQNVVGGLGIIPFVGDDFWRYTIPGRPLLPPVWALMFVVGLVWALWLAWQQRARLQGAAAFVACCWLVLGLAPVLMTGPHLSSTQAMGMQPVLYLFPALALRQVGVASGRWPGVGGKWVYVVGVGLLFVGTAVQTARDYFGVWANAPEVRVQYEAAMAQVMAYLNEQPAAAAISTITPGMYHTPALAQMLLTNEAVQPRWFDGRSSLLLPHERESVVVFSGFAPLAEELRPYAHFPLRTTLPQPETDLDRPLTVNEVDGVAWQAAHQPDTPLAVRFGEAAELVGYDGLATAVAPGDTVQLVTWWRLGQAQPGLRLFTHITQPDGTPFAQADGLGAPSELWVGGDWLLQLHEVVVPLGTAAGTYPVRIGLYTCVDAACEQTERLLVQRDGQLMQDHLTIGTIRVTE